MPRSPRPQNIPDFILEDSIDGPVCGLDEVGRGPLAGPVVAACVYIPEASRQLDFVAHIRDSKKLSSKKLGMLNTKIRAHFFFSIAEIPPVEIDHINILQASLKAMKNALIATDYPNIMHALVDGNRCPQDLPCPATTVVKGDSKSVSIAAASIIAKVHRDRLMQELAQDFPLYGWERNVGYPTKEHISAIEKHGICAHHRKSFGPVKAALTL